MTEAANAKPTGKVSLAGSLDVLLGALAPVTVVTALLVHVGSVRNRAFYGYFGIDQSLLQPSIQDYVLRSVDVTFGAVLRLVAAVLVFIVVDRGLVRLQEWSRSTVVRRVNPLLLTVWSIMSVVGLLSALGVGNGLGIPPPVAAGILAVGAAVVLRLGPGILARNDDTLGRPASVTFYAVLVLALFWAATLYAQDLGQRNAETLDTDPSSLPVVTIFTNQYLDLPGSRISPTATPGQDGRTHYRYSGLALLTHSNGTWFLITGRYPGSYRSSVVVLPESADIRVEVAAR